MGQIQAGAVVGYIGAMEHLIRQAKAEMGGGDLKVIATGGLAVLVAEESNVIDVMDGLLTLKGLCLIHAKNAQH